MNINIIGHFYNEPNGIGKSLRDLVKTIKKIEPSAQFIDLGNNVKLSDPALKPLKRSTNSINIWHINPETLRFYKEYISPKSYNIAYWHWELSSLPKEFLASYNGINEIWTTSNFNKQTFCKYSKTPIFVVPPIIKVAGSNNFSRQYFNIPEDHFIFLSMYDASSQTERKNPKAIITAFKNAFSNTSKVTLVIKLHKNTPQELKKLVELCSGFNIKIIAKTLESPEIYSLINCCDCFVSLHRAEGFGLILAEAMYLGKPVIATNWSGNTDFMNTANSFLVDYRLIKADKTYGPYKAGELWADPNLQQASILMQKLANKELTINNIDTGIKMAYSKEMQRKIIKRRIKQIKLVTTTPLKKTKRAQENNRQRRTKTKI